MMFVANLISFFVGTAASYFVWWVLNHKWVPKIDFSAEICRYLIGEKELCVVAFKNTGRRDIIDAEVLVRIGVKEFNDSSGWQYFNVKTNSSRLPIVSSRKRALIRIFDQRDSINFYDPPSKGLRDEVEKCDTLNDILKIGSDSVVEIHVFGYDKFSGARQHHLSPRYCASDIRTGRFEVLNIVSDK